MVSVKAGAPARTDVGFTDVSVGAEIEAMPPTPDAMVNGRLPDEPPPSPGVNTVTLEMPADVRSLAGITTVSWELLPKTVGLSAPFHRTTEVATKFDPETVMMTDEGLPSMAEFGESDAKPGTGYPIVKVRPDEVPPAGVGLKTVTVEMFSELKSVVRISAVIVVLLMK